VYYALAGKQAILLCEGGDKRTQSADIKRAKQRWNSWQQRMGV
ncbi:MAG: type II toxin-antitoxin system RelE/ParE family toxin, partial [Betaproteobacteria bacterium]|nr:type II toxin-antitoxin system RelE/ParE family toxin [Betaproteobacteria bacterium]